MKTFYKVLSLFVFIGVYTSNAQENVGIGTKTPNSSAVLDIESADKGLLIPRLTMEKRNSILSPATGLMIYQTNENSGFYFYNGSTWKPLAQEDAKAIALDAANWSKTGDAGTNPATNFLGTTDNQPLVFKTNSAESMRILENGNLSLLKDIVVDNTTGGKGVLFKRGGVNRWQQSIDGSESGGDTGSDFNLYGFNDAGGYKFTALNINRATQVTTFGSPINRFTGNFEVDNSVTNRFFVYKKGGNNRWSFQLDGSESGSNLGSDFYFYRYADNGAYLGSQLTLKRATGESQFNGSVKVQTVTGHLAVGDFDGVGLTTPAGYRLIVQDGILTEKIKVALKTSGSDWADYVFEPEYKSKMMSLEEVEKFTLENKHLPNVPSADEMVKTGLDVSQTSKMFMEKIEELTLYMIELNKEVKALKAENEALKKK